MAEYEDKTSQDESAYTIIGEPSEATLSTEDPYSAKPKATYVKARVLEDGSRVKNPAAAKKDRRLAAKGTGLLVAGGAMVVAGIPLLVVPGPFKLIILVGALLAITGWRKVKERKTIEH